MRYSQVNVFSLLELNNGAYINIFYINDVCIEMGREWKGDKVYTLRVFKISKTATVYFFKKIYNKLCSLG